MVIDLVIYIIIPPQISSTMSLEIYSPSKKISGYAPGCVATLYVVIYVVLLCNVLLFVCVTLFLYAVYHIMPCSFVAGYCGMRSREPWKFIRVMEASFVPPVTLDATTPTICLTAPPDGWRREHILHGVRRPRLAI